MALFRFVFLMIILLAVFYSPAFSLHGPLQWQGDIRSTGLGVRFDAPSETMDQQEPEVQGQVGVPISLDKDGDWFSTSKDMLWYGRDCNDSDANVRPGLATDADPHRDGNCNGISGDDCIDPATGQKVSCEKLYCGNYVGKTVVMFGDSVSAGLSLETSKVLQYIGSNSSVAAFHHPAWTWSTGYAPDLRNISGSIYLKMRQRNRCLHNSWINMSFSGATLLDGYNDIYYIKQDSRQDRPILAFSAFLGNDACRWGTPTSEIKYYTTQSLLNLANKVAPGSSLLFFGVMDLDAQFSELRYRRHRVFPSLTYEQFWSIIDKLGLNPCPFLFGGDVEQKRLYIQGRTANITRAIKEAISDYKSYKLQNKLDVDFVDFTDMIKIMLDKVEKESQKNGFVLDKRYAFNELDGFHPDLSMHPIIAETVWEWLEKHHPEWLGPINPNNDAIDKKFGYLMVHEEVGKRPGIPPFGLETLVTLGVGDPIQNRGSLFGLSLRHLLISAFLGLLFAIFVSLL